MGVVLSAGGAFAWYRDQLARELVGSAGADAKLDTEAASVPPGADGVTFLPYLQGERTPHRDASARAAFLGLSLAHSRAHMTRAVLEGIAFALRDSLSILQSWDSRPAPPAHWRGREEPVHSTPAGRRVWGAGQHGEPGGGPAYGAALLAAVGAGAFPDVASAARATLTRGGAEQPDSQAHGAYQTAYDRFRASYRASLPSLA
jgi:xylulokinase